MSAPSIFRYPGGKSRLVKSFLRYIPEDVELYVEPFVGGGSVLLNVAERTQTFGGIGRNLRFSINDSNPDVAAFWATLVGDESAYFALRHRVETIKPTVELFHRIQEEDYCCDDDRAFRCLFINRTSFSGIMDSGPIGGEAQATRELTVRWKPPELIRQMKEARALLLGKTSVTCCDFSKVLESANRNAFAYLDPPYYEKGGQLYGKYGKWTEEDHMRLRELLDKVPRWLLSYDNNPKVKKLYAGFKIEELQHYRSISGHISEGTKRPRDKSELLIFSKDTALPATADVA